MAHVLPPLYDGNIVIRWDQGPWQPKPAVAALLEAYPNNCPECGQVGAFRNAHKECKWTKCRYKGML
jgi:hypothetical protein